jgi:hypothetical protein
VKLCDFGIAKAAALTGLAAVSFAIALAASKSSRERRAGVDPPTGNPAARATVSSDGLPFGAPRPTMSGDGPPGDPELGYLEISTKPEGGTIRIGDQSRTSPADFVWPAGDVLVTAELEGYTPEYRVVHLLALAHEKVEIAMSRKLSRHEHGSAPAVGRLTVRTRPNAQVFEGSRKLADTPFADLELSPGPHVLTFKSPEHSTTTKTIVVAAGKSQTLSFDLP